MQSPKRKTMQLQLFTFQSESAFQQCRYMMSLPLLWNINVGLGGSVSFKYSRVLCLHWELSQKLLWFIFPHKYLELSKKQKLIVENPPFYFFSSKLSFSMLSGIQIVDFVWLTVELLKYILRYNDYFSIYFIVTW